ncbi:MAG: hypothetical protein JWM78_3369, partial [Verrucomicrobiaceae bacterium]|nr:hypothetical protein [Verrucomicrobiaceae bacterium]
TLNQLGENLDIKSIVPLSSTSLINQAVSNAGLSDFGGGRWLQHFEVLMKAVDGEARLHLAGRVLTRCEMVLYLEARLQIVEAYKRNPDIDDEHIDQPVFITGFGRSGTTILFEVLAQDPQFRVAAKWEALFPCPPPTTDSYHSDERIEKADRVTELLESMTPEFKTAHKLGSKLPVESLETEYSAFLSDVYPIIFQIPSYAKYLATQDLTETIEWQKKTLKLLQYKHKAKHWLMKSPSHLPHLRKILTVFPAMRVIFTHRDPVVTADSIVSVMGMLYWLRTDQPWGDGAIESWSLSLAKDRASAWTDIIAMIESGHLAKGHFANFHYVEFMADPLAAIRKIYRELDMTLTPEVEQRMHDFLGAKTQGKFGKHHYEQTPDGVVDHERDAYADYQRFFGVQSEI